MPHFILDCDDVLLDWIGGFSSWLGQYNLFPAEVLARPVLNWDLAEWLGCDRETTAELVKSFNTSPQFGKLGRVYQSSRLFDTLPHVHRLLTAPGNTATVVSAYLAGDRSPLVRALQERMRRKNLHEAYGMLGVELVSLDLGSGKLDTFRAIFAQRGACVSLDDNVTHASAAAKAGHQSFVFSRPHNVGLRGDLRYTDLTWVDDWKNFVSRFSSDSPFGGN